MDGRHGPFLGCRDIAGHWQGCEIPAFARMTGEDVGEGWAGRFFDFYTILYHFDPFCGVGPGWSALGHGPPGASVAAWVLVVGLCCLVTG